MKIDEIKLRIHNFVDETIDLYIPPTNIIDRLKNTTAKFWVEQNLWKLDKLLCYFADNDNEICIDSLLEHYEAALFEDGDLKLDVKELIPSDMQTLKSMLPNKVILFKKSDLIDIFNDTHNNHIAITNVSSDAQ